MIDFHFTGSVQGFRSRAGTLLTLVVLGLSGWTAGAQQSGEAPPKPISDVERLVRDGAADALESKLAGGRTPEELRQLAQAYINKGRKAKQAAERQRAFDKANEKYVKYVTALERATGDAEKNAVQLAAGRVEFANSLLGQQAGPELDEYELTAGQKGDRERMKKLVAQARDEYDKALVGLKPIVDELARREDELLTKGVFETLQQSRFDALFNLGWAQYWAGVFEPKSEAAKREALLKASERRFQELIELGQSGPMLMQCNIGLGVTQREQNRLEDSQRSLTQALQAAAAAKEVAVEAQSRVELTRTLIRAGKFDEARATLKPLLEKDPANLAAEDRPAKFYINLALIMDATSHFAEAEALRREAENSPAQAAILQKAQRTRETGLAKMNRLSARGGAWPGLVQLHVAASVNLNADLRSLSPLELMFTAAQLTESKRFKEAVARLQEAAGRKDVEPTLAGQILFQLGKTQYAMDDQRAAAATFQRMAVEYKSHDLAAQAATNAFQLWAKVAEKSKNKDDYERLAQTVLNLLQTFPDHPERGTAMWWLPVALQLAGKPEEAAAQYANVPQGSERWEEAQYRRAVCGRVAAEAARSALSADEYAKRAQTAAAALTQYADEAEKRATKTAAGSHAIRWCAEARINAAELLVSAGVDDPENALKALKDFEATYGKSEAAKDLLGRVLAVRIRAYRGLRRFDEASGMLQQYLAAVSPEEAGGTLAVLAKGMQDEVQRLVEEGQLDAGRKLATESLTTFEELEKWVRADARRAKSVDVVVVGRAQMLLLAGDVDGAEKAARALLAAEPKNGNYQHLFAQAITERLDTNAPAAEVEAAEKAWAALLVDPAIRQRAPERYWEARTEWLALLLRQGRAADVAKAIEQERIWYPDLGGPPWNVRLEALWKQAREKQGLSTEIPPATMPADPAAADAPSDPR